MDCARDVPAAVACSAAKLPAGSGGAFAGNRRPGTGFGTIVLPCGAGKTVVGMTVMAMLRTSTLILTTNVAAVHQWLDELVDKSACVAKRDR